MNSIAKRIFKLSPLKLGLCLILFPFIALLLQGLFVMTYIFTGAETIFPLFDFSILIIHVIFFVWIWTISVNINKTHLQIKTTLFKVSFFLYAFHRLFSFIMALELEITKTGWYLENSTIAMIENLMLFYGFLVFVAYIYICVFTGNIISKLTTSLPKRTIDQIPSFLLMIIFPLGLPLLQSKLQAFLCETRLFGFKPKKRPVPPIQSTVKTPIETTKDTSTENNIDKEDPRRFMPK